MHALAPRLWRFAIPRLLAEVGYMGDVGDVGVREFHCFVKPRSLLLDSRSRFWRGIAMDRFDED